MINDEPAGNITTATVIRLLEPGAIVDGRYKILQPIAEGGSGTVFKALEIELERVVTIKVLHKDIHLDAEAEARFLREGKILSALSHPNIVTFYRFGLWNDQAYIAMEYVDGETLEHVFESAGRLTIERTIELALQLCDSMAAAHKAGIVHRDLKPANIMLIADASAGKQHTKILDFGVSFLTTPEGEVSQRLTRTGVVIGSLPYMSPEQCTGKKVDHRSDIYSLGCILYEALAGGKPFECDSPIGLLHKHMSEFPDALTKKLKNEKIDPAVLSGVDSVIFKALSKDADDRYQSMDELREDLQLILNGQIKDITAVPIQRRKKKASLLLFGVPLLLLAIATPLVYLTANRRTAPALQTESSTIPGSSSNRLVARTLLSRYEVYNLPLDKQIDYYKRWLSKYGNKVDLQSANANGFLALALLQSTKEKTTPEIQNYAHAARSGYLKHLELWRTKAFSLDDREMYELVTTLPQLLRILEKENEIPQVMGGLLKQKQRLTRRMVQTVFEELSYYYKRHASIDEEERWLSAFLREQLVGKDRTDHQVRAAAQTMLASVKRRRGDSSSANRLLNAAIRDIEGSEEEASYQTIHYLIEELQAAGRLQEALKFAEINESERSSIRTSIYRLKAAELRLLLRQSKENMVDYLTLLNHSESCQRWYSMSETHKLLPPADLIKMFDFDIAHTTNGNSVASIATSIATDRADEDKTASDEFVQHVAETVTKRIMQSSREEFQYLYSCANAAGYLLERCNKTENASRFFSALLDREAQLGGGKYVVWNRQLESRLRKASGLMVAKHYAEAESVLKECEAETRQRLPETRCDLAEVLTLQADIAARKNLPSAALELASEAVTLTKDSPQDSRFRLARELKAILLEKTGRSNEAALIRFQLDVRKNNSGK